MTKPTMNPRANLLFSSLGETLQRSLALFSVAALWTVVLALTWRLLFIVASFTASTFALVGITVQVLPLTFLLMVAIVFFPRPKK